MKNILITGSGSGIGYKAAIELASRGYFVYATTHFKYEADKLNKLNKKWCLPLFSFKLDIVDKKDRNKVRNLDIDILINNAAIGDSGSIAEIDVSILRSTFETNVFSSIELTQIVLKDMIKKRKGRIIFISSLAGRNSIPFLSPYCATKFALECIGPSLNKELKKLKGVNIPVILIEPGCYATGFNQRNISKQFYRFNDESYFKNHIKKLKFKQYTYFKLREVHNLESVIQKYIEAVEDENPKERYVSPMIQAGYIMFKNIFR